MQGHLTACWWISHQLFQHINIFLKWNESTAMWICLPLKFFVVCGQRPSIFKTVMVLPLFLNELHSRRILLISEWQQVIIHLTLTKLLGKMLTEKGLPWIKNHDKNFFIGRNETKYAFLTVVWEIQGPTDLLVTGIFWVQKWLSSLDRKPSWPS